MLAEVPTTRWSALLFLTVWLLAASYLGFNLNKGWDPIDEGALGQSAERVLHGEMPHRDFYDGYTGGMAYVDAAIFNLFGINLLWPRVFLLILFLAWVPAIYSLAREFLAPWPAAGATLVSVAWSVPNYPAAMPSWFNLYLATFGALALAKYIRKPTVNWLIWAGLCGGVSFLIKSTALYYIAAVLLFFVYREQSLSRACPAGPRSTTSYLAFLAACLSLFVVALVKLVFDVAGPADYLHFVLPGSAVAVALIGRERYPASVSSWSRFRSLFGMIVPFLAAVALPILLFFLVFWSRGGLAALFDSLFATPFQFIQYVHREPSDVVLEYPSLVAALLVVEAAKLRGNARLVLSLVLTALTALVLFNVRGNDLAFIIGLQAAWGIVPVLAVAGVMLLFFANRLPTASPERDQLLVLLFAMTTLFSLIQFPFAQIMYFCYGAPITTLFAASLLARLTNPPRLVLHVAAAFFILFPFLEIRPQYLGKRYHFDKASLPLQLPRTGSLRVWERDAKTYGELIPLVERLGENNHLLAGPDCPEVYFLSGLRNPTPVLFDFFENPTNYELGMKALLDQPGLIRVAVINDTPGYSADQLHILRLLVLPRFPNSRKIGKFTVYWRQ